MGQEHGRRRLHCVLAWGEEISPKAGLAPPPSAFWAPIVIRLVVIHYAMRFPEFQRGPFEIEGGGAYLLLGNRILERSQFCIFSHRITCNLREYTTHDDVPNH